MDNPKSLVEKNCCGGLNWWIGALNRDGKFIVVVTRLLIPNNTVGFVIGENGDAITGLRSEVGARVCVMPTDQLPACAMSNGELVVDVV
ncbi:K Homology domain-containing protein [Artemisia annua]|uniref:K Homology domain-containing protein n=1 Tax=Artemisia annua TaxID=35608 RepID=A0A2U1MMB2_ARTAN|nr:K Homology domain-containing protein [Artemisia annua]